MSRLKLTRRSNIFALVLILLVFLNEHRSKVLGEELPVSSTGTCSVKDPGDNYVGPCIELSSTVLKTNEELKYICREGTSAERNTLGHIIPGGGIKPIGSVNGQVCNHEVDRNFWCTVNRGTIKWNRELGGKYACTAFPDVSYVIHWIDPVAKVPDSIDYSNEVYGANLRFHCSVDMTPTDINYGNILTIVWQWTSAKTGGQWANLPKDSNGVKYGIDSTGPNSTLSITSYSPILHGGEYRCTVTVRRYKEPLQSKSFTIHSKPKAILRNDKRDDFHFGVDEKFTITCYGQSYPFPSKIEFRIHAATLNLNHPGITGYQVDTIGLNEKRHYAKFTVINATSVFPINDSVIECRVYRPDGQFKSAQARVALFEVAPPITATESPINPHVREREEPTRPWVIAIAVIIPIIILLIIAVLLVWKCKRFGDDRDGGNIYYTPSQDPYADHRSIGSQRTRKFSDAQSVNSQSTYAPSQYVRGQHNRNYTGGSQYATPRVEHNPLYASHYGKGGRANGTTPSKEPLTKQYNQDNYDDNEETEYRPNTAKYSTTRSNRSTHGYGYASPSSLKRY